MRSSAGLIRPSRSQPVCRASPQAAFRRQNREQGPQTKRRVGLSPLLDCAARVRRDATGEPVRAGRLASVPRARGVGGKERPRDAQRRAERRGAVGGSERNDSDVQRSTRCPRLATQKMKGTA